MKLTEEQIRLYPAIACLTSGHSTHSHFESAQAYKERYGDELPTDLALLRERGIEELNELDGLK